MIFIQKSRLLAKPTEDLTSYYAVGFARSLLKITVPYR